MSESVPVHMVDTFNDGLTLLSQQMPSVMAAAGALRMESKTGERNSFDQIGPVAARKRTTRNGDTEYINTPHLRRWVNIDDYDVADLLDTADVLRILNEPTGAYAQNFVAALNREMDASSITASIGTSLTGKTGVTPVALPGGQLIAAGGTGFTLAKVRSAMKKFKAANAVQQNGTNLYVAWTADQEDEFLDTTEVKSHDFNTQRVLVKGGMGDNEFYGFTYMRLEDWTDETGALHRILPKTGTVRSCVAWIKGGILRNMPRPPTTTVDRMPNKKNSQQVFTTGTFGDSRMQESWVVQIDVEEA